MSDLREEVRERYAEAARAVREGKVGDDWHPEVACCGPECCAPHDGLGVQLYDAKEREDLPEEAVLASLGCGNPTAVADLHEGETVLDLGSGGGIDVLLSARRVGPTGKAYGLDMTDEMLELARENAHNAGATNVEFLKGLIEEVPLPDSSVDVIISNCVINLSTDKPKVIAEMQRVLRPGGRLGISDVVSSDELAPEQRAERGSYVGCIAGALSFTEYRGELARAGFEDIQVEPTHELVDQMFGAIVRARKPETASAGERTGVVEHA
jgi:arsenite methyltransferase